MGDGGRVEPVHERCARRGGDEPVLRADEQLRHGEQSAMELWVVERVRGAECVRQLDADAQRDLRILLQRDLGDASVGLCALHGRGSWRVGDEPVLRECVGLQQLLGNGDDPLDLWVLRGLHGRHEQLRDGNADAQRDVRVVL